MRKKKKIRAITVIEKDGKTFDYWYLEDLTAQDIIEGLLEMTQEAQNEWVRIQAQYRPEWVGSEIVIDCINKEKKIWKAICLFAPDYLKLKNLPWFSHKKKSKRKRLKQL